MSVVKVKNGVKEEASDSDDDEKSGTEGAKVNDDEASGQDHDDLMERCHDDSRNQSPISNEDTQAAHTETVGISKENSKDA